MRTHPPRPTLVLALACLLAILLFFIGRAAPQAHLWGSYLLPIVLVFLWGRHNTWRRDIYIVTALASILIAVTFWTGGIPAGGNLLTSYLLPILLLWAVAWLLAQRRQLQEQLDAQVRSHTAALGASEAQLNKIFRANPGGIAISRLSDGCFLDANPAYLQMLGYTRDELVGRTSVDLGILSAAARAQIVDRVKRGDAAVPFAVPLHTKTGATIDVMTAIDTIDFAGEPCYLSFMVDITTRKQLEARARRLAALVDAAQDAIMSADLDGTIVTLNRSAEVLYGTSADAVVGQNMVRLTQPDYVAPLQEMLGRISEGEAATLDDIAWTLPDGCTRSLSIALSPIRDESGQVRGFASSARDVTVRNQMAREVARLAAIVQSSNDAIISADLDGTLRSMNPAAELLFGITAGEAIGRHISLINPDLPEADRTAMFARLAAGELFTLPDLTWTAAGGRCVDLSVTALPFVDPGGRVQGVASIARDISERKAAERTLRDSEERFAHLFSSSPVCITLSRLADGRYLEVNDAFLAMVGYSRDELVGRTSLELGIINSADRLRLVAELQEQGHVSGTDLVLSTKGGEQRATLYAVEPLTLDGDPCLLSSIVDISERKRLEETANRLAAIVESSSDAIASTDLQGRVVSWNRSAEQIYGYSASQAIGHPISELLPPGPDTDEAAIVARVRSGNTVPVADSVMTRADGTRVDLSIVLSPVKDKHGAVVGMASIVRDITARKRLEDELQASVERWNMAAEISSIGVWDWRAGSDQVIWDERMYLLHGLAPGTTVTFAAWRALIHPDDRAAVEEKSRKSGTERTRVPVEYRVVLPDGSLRYLLSIAGGLYDESGTPVRQLGITMDITERKQLEAALRNSEARYRLLVDNAEDVIWMADVDGRFTFVNPAVECQLGYRPEEVIGQRFDRWLTQASAAAAMETLAETVAQLSAGQRPEAAQFEGEQIRKDGTLIFTQTIGVPLLDEAGLSTGFLGITRDVTERKQAEEALAASEHKYRELYDNSPDMYVSGYANGSFRDCNLTAARTLGYTPEELMGLPTSTIFAPASYSRVQAELPEHLAAGRWDNFEVQLQCKDGAVLDALLSAQFEPATPDHLPYSRVTLHDITERKAAERQIARLASIVQNSNDAIVSTDFDGTLRSINPAGEQMLGINAAEAVGQHVSLVNPELPQSERAAIFARIRAGEAFTLPDFTWHAHDGRCVDLSVTAVPLLDRGSRYWPRRPSLATSPNARPSSAPWPRAKGNSATSTTTRRTCTCPAILPTT